METVQEKPASIGRWLDAIATIPRSEQRAVLTAFLLFFCVLCGYFMLRPVRETIGTMLGEKEVEGLFMATWFGSIAVIPLYGLACSLLPRALVLASVYGTFGASLMILSAVMSAYPGNVAAARFFYVWISIFALLVVSVFWTLMVDRSTAEQAKRTFGIVAAGGTIGALAAPVLTDLLIGPLGRTGVLTVSACFFGAAIILQAALLRVWRAAKGDESNPRTTSERIGGNPFAGITLVLRSSYLLAFCVFMILLASATTFLYFDQLRLVSEMYPVEADRTRIFARIDFIVQGLALLTQFFFTSRIARRLGVGMLLVSVPVVMMFGFLALAVISNFWILAIVMVARRAGEYALTRPGREILFTAIGVEGKYKAKNLIDVVVYRGGDALSASLRGVLRSTGLSSASLAIVGAGLALLWAVVGWWLGRTHEDRNNRAARHAA